MKTISLVACLVICSVGFAQTELPKVPIDPRQTLGKSVSSMRQIKSGLKWVRTNSAGEVRMNMRLNAEDRVNFIGIQETSATTKFLSEYAFLDYAQAFLKRYRWWNPSVRFRLASRNHWEIDGLSNMPKGAQAHLTWKGDVFKIEFRGGKSR